MTVKDPEERRASFTGLEKDVLEALSNDPKTLGMLGDWKQATEQFCLAIMNLGVPSNVLPTMLIAPTIAVANQFTGESKKDEFFDWIISLDEADNQERRTITLTEIINRAREAKEAAG